GSRLFFIACLATPDILLAQPFFDDFSRLSLNPVYQAALPDASWRFGAGIATYIGAPSYSFENIEGAGIIQLRTVLNNAQRVGWSSTRQFSAIIPIRLEARINTLIQSPSTGIDEPIEIWILDAGNLDRFDKVALSAPNFGLSRVFTAGSSITDIGLDTSF